MSIGQNYCKCSKIVCLNQVELTVWRLEEESVRNAACHPYYLTYLMKEVLAEVGDFKIGGRIINKVRFADDKAIIAKTQEELQEMANR